MCQQSASAACHLDVVNRLMLFCSPYSLTLIASRLTESRMLEFAQAHNQEPAWLLNEPIIWAGARAILSGNVKINAPESCAKSQRSDFPRPHVSWCALF